MENASKALLIAASIFIAIILVSSLMILYNQISDYQNKKYEMSVIEETQKINEKFENYHRNNIRGSDLISLMNRIIHYNSSQSYQDGTNYERIRVTITLVKDGNNQDAILDKFKYPTDDNTSRNTYLINKITNTNGTGTNWQNDKKLIEITNTSSDLSDDLRSYDIEFISDTQLQKLASQIESIMINDSTSDSTWDVYMRLKRAELIKDVLGKEIKIDPNTGKTKNESKDFIKAVKEIASKYYQYMQFKRAYFNCIEVKYDEQTNRVVEMNFELQVKDGEVVFN